MILLQTTNAAQETEKVAEELASGNSEYINDLVRQGISLAVSAGKSILIALIIYFVGRFVIRLVNRLVGGVMERRKMDPTIQTFLRSLINILMMVLLIVTVISALGVNTTSFAALLASAGVAVGMALSGNLQNFAGGIIILLFRPYRVGDYISAQGCEGFVVEIQIFHTIIRTWDNRKIYLPNGAMSSGSISNWSKEEKRRMDFNVGVEYGQDVEKVRRVTLAMLDRDVRILKDPAPRVILISLGESSVDLIVRVWVDNADYWDVLFTMYEQIYTEFNRQGIGFPFPQLTVHNSPS